ncbi:hypothetical protein [Aeromicrobium erythreum]|nr:hypothetical protein [Aeromicrobium erythreum]MCX6407078.1 hypothetical protein [Propionibacteriales bacterium]
MEENAPAHGLPVVLSVLLSLAALLLGWRGDIGVAWAVVAVLLAGAAPALALLPHGRWPSVLALLGSVVTLALAVAA